MQEYEHILIHEHRLMKLKLLKKSVMCRYEQEQAQRRTTRPRKGRYTR